MEMGAFGPTECSKNGGKIVHNCKKRKWSERREKTLFAQEQAQNTLFSPFSEKWLKRYGLEKKAISVIKS